MQHGSYRRMEAYGEEAANPSDGLRKQRRKRNRQRQRLNKARRLQQLTPEERAERLAKRDAKRLAERSPSQREYAAYIASPTWTATRGKALAHHGTQCYACSGHKSLQVHHKNYARIGREKMSDLVVLCNGCHKAAHKAIKARKTTLKNAHKYVKDQRS